MATGRYVEVSPGENIAARATCDPGDLATGGGHYHLRGALSYPSSSLPVVEGGSPVGWTIFFSNQSPDEVSHMAPMVMCMDTSP